MSPELDRLCPDCGHKSYGGGSTPRVKNGLVYRRRLCLREACATEFVVVEGTVTGNPVLAEFLAAYHEVYEPEPKPEPKKELLS
jgi:hypothetical protein